MVPMFVIFCRRNLQEDSDWRWLMAVALPIISTIAEVRVSVKTLNPAWGIHSKLSFHVFNPYLLPWTLVGCLEYISI